MLYAFAVEPRWVVMRTIRLADAPSRRLVHITDLHYKGDRAYLERIVRRLYVNPGLGTFYAPIRLGCRPEVTLIEL
jgi:predicted MPP superfamily phosphohydrolase